jgi:hypothetical protein
MRVFVQKGVFRSTYTCGKELKKEGQMLQKEPLAGRDVEVTFRCLHFQMPPIDDVVELNLCGDFNDWKVKGFPSYRKQMATWVARVVLRAGKSHRFRYNDREADSWVPNDFGSQDSVLNLTADFKKTTKVASKRKRAGGLSKNAGRP